MLLEIAAFNFHSALLAAHAGADRIEICENMPEGGVTPSFGAVKRLKELTAIPVFPMIRPRGGDFLYSDDEVAVMAEDIHLFKQLGCEGVVLGLLKANGAIDIERTKRLVEIANPMEVTFHRAFDRSVDPMQALEDIISCNCKRILTSGQMPVATEGIPLLKKLIQAASDKIIIIPGCGVTSANIIPLASETGAFELHSSARKMLPGAMTYINPSLNEKLDMYSIDIDDIIRMKEQLYNYSLNK